MSLKKVAVLLVISLVSGFLLGNLGIANAIDKAPVSAPACGQCTSDNCPGDPSACEKSACADEACAMRTGGEDGAACGMAVGAAGTACETGACQPGACPPNAATK